MIDSRASKARKLYRQGWSKNQIRRELSISPTTLDKILEGVKRGKPVGAKA